MNGNLFFYTPELIWATPTIVTPDNQEEVLELDNLLERSLATKLFLDGELSIADYLDFLEDSGYDTDEYLDVVEDRLEQAYTIDLISL